MKLLVTIFTLLTALQAHAFTDAQVYKLYTSGKVIEKSLSEAKLPEAKKAIILEKMKQTALYLANVWYDTVLEGPYQLLGDAALETDNIVALYSGKELIGFFGTVSAEAAYSDECAYNDELSEEEASKEYKDCLQDYKGSIVENFLVNKNGDQIEEYQEPGDFQD